MKLDDWLRRTATPRNAFAKAAGLSPASVTGLCNDAGAWISRDTAGRIAAATGGAVTPNDFLGLGPGKETCMTMHRLQAAIEAFTQGDIVVVTDDDDRENEGDLVLAATHCT